MSSISFYFSRVFLNAYVGHLRDQRRFHVEILSDRDIIHLAVIDRLQYFLMNLLLQLLQGCKLCDFVCILFHVVVRLCLNSLPNPSPFRCIPVRSAAFSPSSLGAASSPPLGSTSQSILASLQHVESLLWTLGGIFRLPLRPFPPLLRQLSQIF